MMDDDQQFCLRWNNHQSTLISVFDTLLENGTLVDCTLAAEGQFLKAHKVVLSACSPYFANLLKEQYDKHPIFILKDVKYQELRAMMDYMYRGEVNISQDQLAALLKAAESLQIKGLSDNRSPTSGQQQHQQQQQQQQHQKSEQHQKLNVPGIKNNSGGGGGGGSGGGGYTLEQTKRPRIGPTSIDSQDINREGSSSPTSRKRKKIRRRSVENVMDNHEHSNSSAHSIQQINSTAPMTSINTSGTSAVVSALQSSSNTQQTSVNISKKTESVLNIKQNIGGDIITTTGTTISAGNTNTGTTDDDNQNDNELMKPINKKEQNHKRKQQQQQQHEKDELLLEPKNEYDDVNETIEDLTEDPDDEDIMDEDIGQAGPSHHGGEGSSQGFPQWPADRSQDEFIMAAQDQGQQRDPQGDSIWTLVEALPTSTTVLSTGGQSQTTHTVLLQIPASMTTSGGLQNSIQLQTLIPATTQQSTPTTTIKNEQSKNNSIKSNFTVQEIHSIETIEHINHHHHNQLQEICSEQDDNNINPREIIDLPTDDDGDDDDENDDDEYMDEEIDTDEKSNQINEVDVKISSNHQMNVFNKIEKIENDDASTILNTNDQISQTDQDQEQKLQIKSMSRGYINVGNTSIQKVTASNEQTHKKLKKYNSNVENINKSSSTATTFNSNKNLPYVCDVCGKPYKIKGSLKRHKSYECGVVAALACKYCSHRSKYYSDLKKHLLQRHPNLEADFLNKTTTKKTTTDVNVKILLDQ